MIFSLYDLFMAANELILCPLHEVFATDINVIERLIESMHASCFDAGAFVIISLDMFAVRAVSLRVKQIDSY